jgi:hypothetical protein
MMRGHGSLFLATRKFVAVLGLPLIASRAPAPTWWADDSGCTWTAAWLTVRGRAFRGPRELLDDREWSGQLNWFDRDSFKRSGHRPDLVAFRADARLAIEVELAPKSKSRSDAIISPHLGWIIRGKTHAVVYVCGDQEACSQIERAAERAGLYSSSGRLRSRRLRQSKRTLSLLTSRPGPPARWPLPDGIDRISGCLCRVATSGRLAHVSGNGAATIAGGRLSSVGSPRSGAPGGHRRISMSRSAACAGAARGSGGGKS